MKKNNIYIIFSILGVVIVLWQLLLSGYVLTLDMVFGPHMNLTRNAGDLLNTLPFYYILYAIKYIFGGWIMQKILLVTIFFLMFYFPLRYFKKIFNLEETYGVEFVVSLFFVINPFVYERFLAGQWAVLFGYVLLVPILAYLISFCRDWNNRNTLKLLASIVILGAVSTHILMISLVIIPIVIFANFIYQKWSLSFLKKSILLGLGVIIISSYWLIPAILSKGTVVTTFGADHWEVFKTATNSHIGTIGNVLSLHGFWGEHEEWIKRFVLPSEGGWVFVTSLFLFIGIVFTGIYAGVKDKKIRLMVFLLIFVMFLATVFSSGITDGIFKNFNMWMFENVSFWKGFRDSEKWSAILALGYALLAGLGARYLISNLKNIKYQKVALYMILTIPILYTPMMLFGLSGQIKTTQYPDSWNEVNNVLREDKNCKALFLPWHQYFSLRFNQDILSANPAGVYFDCGMVQGKNMELGSISSQGGNGEDYETIENVIIDNNANIDNTIKFLREKGIKYIIYTDDIDYEDPYLYPFLKSDHLVEVFHSKGIYLYRIN